jgi:hypothetical protein
MTSFIEANRIEKGTHETDLRCDRSGDFRWRGIPSNFCGGPDGVTDPPLLTGARLRGACDKGRTSTNCLAADKYPAP